LAGGGGAAVGGPSAVGGRVGEEDSAERRLGAEGGATGKTTEAPRRTIEAGGETVGAWSAGDAAEVDGAAGGGVDSTGVQSAVLRGWGLGSVAWDGVAVEGRCMEDGSQWLVGEVWQLFCKRPGSVFRDRSLGVDTVISSAVRS
jgi:hypothetical protein